MRRFAYILLCLALCGCATTQKKQLDIVLWTEVQKVMNNPFMVDEILLEKHKAWPQRETRITEHANKKGDVLWVYEHINWSKFAPGLTVRTIQCIQHNEDKERRRWLSYLSIDVDMFASYMKLTRQKIPPEIRMSPIDAREQYGTPSSDTIDENGDGHIIWSIVSNPPYNLRSNIRMQFREGFLKQIDFGELRNND